VDKTRGYEESVASLYGELGKLTNEPTVGKPYTMGASGGRSRTMGEPTTHRAMASGLNDGRMEGRPSACPLQRRV